MTDCPSCLNGCGGVRSDCPKHADSSGAERKVVGRPFGKGQSGNPGGLPKGTAEVKAAARALTTDAITTLATIMGNTDAPAAARVAAANSILDRGWGKPQQSVELNDKRPLSGISAGALLAALASLPVEPEPSETAH